MTTLPRMLILSAVAALLQGPTAAIAQPATPAPHAAPAPAAAVPETPSDGLM